MRTFQKVDFEARNEQYQQQTVYSVNANRETTDGLLNYNEAILYTVPNDASNSVDNISMNQIKLTDTLPSYQEVLRNTNSN